MEEVQSEPPPLFDNIDFNTSDQDYEIFESAVQQVRNYAVFDQNNTLAILFLIHVNLNPLCFVSVHFILIGIITTLTGMFICILLINNAHIVCLSVSSLFELKLLVIDYVTDFQRILNSLLISKYFLVRTKKKIEQKKCHVQGCIPID